MTKDEALAELRAVGIKARYWLGRFGAIYLNDGTNWSLPVSRSGEVEDVTVWRAIAGHVAGYGYGGAVRWYASSGELPPRLRPRVRIPEDNSRRLYARRWGR